MSGRSLEDYKPKMQPVLTKRNLNALIKWGPLAAQTIQDISNKMAPQEQALQLQLLQQFAPEFSKVGSDIATQEALADIGRDTQLIQGPGKQLTESALALDKLINPEYYSTMQTAATGFNNLIGGQDPNKLSGAELANTERSVNRLNARTGNLNTGDATTTAANAMLFGDELGKKRDRFAQSLALFPGISSGSRSPIDTFGTATGKASKTANFGQQQFNPTTGSDTTKTLQDQIFQMGQQREDIMSNRRHAQDYFEGAVSSVNCCFIMIAANEGKELPWHIRFCRDYYYQRDPQVKTGYKKMAKWLVPLMQKYPLIRKFIKYTMYNPISSYGEYLVGENKYGKIFKPIKNFWFSIWRTL